MLGQVRRGSAIGKLLDLLPVRPILSADDACIAIASSRSSVFAAIDRLRAAEVIRAADHTQARSGVGRQRDLDELDDLPVRIAQAST